MIGVLVANLYRNLLHAWQRKVRLLAQLLAVVLLKFVQVGSQQLRHKDQVLLKRKGLTGFQRRAAHLQCYHPVPQQANEDNTHFW